MISKMDKSKLIFLSIVVLNVFGQLDLFAQDRFDLEKRDGHLYFTAAIQETPVELMMESGIPALLVGHRVYDSCLKSSGLVFQPSRQKIRLLDHLYDIVYRAEGEIGIGNVLYDGPVFILEDYDGVSVPIQYLKDPVSKRSVLTIDLKDNYLIVGKSEENDGGTRFKLRFDKELGFPTVAAVVDVVTPDGSSRLKGDLIVDFGNPALLFLLKQHKSIARAIEKETLALQDAFNGQGQLIAQGIYAYTVSMFGREYSDLSIGVTDKMPSIGQLGFLGIPFFESPVVFDFDHGVMMME
jgi:hypothetical protein